MATINQNVAGCNRRPGVQTQVRPLSVGISSNNSRDRSLHPAYGRIRCGFYRLITRSSIAVPCNYGSTDTRVRRSQTHTRERTYTEQNHRASLNVRLCTYLKPQPPCPPLSVKRTPFLAGGQRKTDRQTDRQREREREREREVPSTYLDRRTLSRADVAEDAAGVARELPPVHLPVLLRATLLPATPRRAFPRSKVASTLFTFGTFRCSYSVKNGVFFFQFTCEFYQCNR